MTYVATIASCLTPAEKIIFPTRPEHSYTRMCKETHTYIYVYIYVLDTHNTYKAYIDDDGKLLHSCREDHLSHASRASLALLRVVWVGRRVHRRHRSLQQRNVPLRCFDGRAEELEAYERALENDIHNMHAYAYIHIHTHTYNRSILVDIAIAIAIYYTYIYIYIYPSIYRQISNRTPSWPFAAADHRVNPNP